MYVLAFSYICLTHRRTYITQQHTILRKTILHEYEVCKTLTAAAATSRHGNGSWKHGPWYEHI